MKLIKMKILLLTVLLQIIYPEYEFKSTSLYLNQSYTQLNIEDNSFTIYDNYNKPGPRKVSGLDGWLYWIMWGRNNGVPSNASNEDLFGYYDYIQNGGILNYNDWWNQKYNPTPIDDIIPLLLFITIYFYYNYCKNRLLGG